MSTKKFLNKKWVQKVAGGVLSLVMAASVAAPAAAPVSAGPLARDAIATTAAVAHVASHVGTAVELAREFDLPTAILNPARNANILMLQGVKLATIPLTAIGPVTRNVLGTGATIAHLAATPVAVATFPIYVASGAVNALLPIPFPASLALPSYRIAIAVQPFYLTSSHIRHVTTPYMINQVVGNTVDAALLGAGALGTAAVATPVVLFVANTPLRVARHATEAAVIGAGAVGAGALAAGAAAVPVTLFVANTPLRVARHATEAAVVGAGALGAAGLGAATLGTTAVVGTGAAAAGVAGLIALNALNNNDEEEPTDETTPTDTTKEASDKTSTDTDTTDYNANDQSYLEQAVHAIHDSIFGSSDETSTASENQVPAENTEATLEEAPTQA